MNVAQVADGRPRLEAGRRGTLLLGHQIRLYGKPSHPKVVSGINGSAARDSSFFRC